MSAIAKDVFPTDASRGVALSYGNLIDVTDAARAHGLPAPLAIECDVYALTRGFDGDAKLRNLLHSAALAVQAARPMAPRAEFRHAGALLEIRSEPGDDPTLRVYTIARATAAPRYAMAA